MFKVSVRQVVEMTRGELVNASPELEAVEVGGVSTDSRTIKGGRGGELFVALCGETFDGHRFVQAALDKGAPALLVETHAEIPPASAALIRVPDTLKALGDLAHGWRLLHGVPVVAITGTSGKTTTKELVRDCLATNLSVLATEGNFNNLIGLPKTLFRLHDTHDVAVLEMGMNRFGEIRRLAEIAEPHYGLITNIGAGHTEGVGGIEGVAKAKGELLEVMDGEGCFFANAEDARVMRLAAAFSGDVISYGFARDCDVQAADVAWGEKGLSFTVRTPWETRPFHTRFWGRHQIENALAAIVVAQSFGISLEACASIIEAKEGAPGRGRLLALAGGDVLLLDDAYNANPTSVRACLRWFESLDATWTQCVFVFGTMYELGDAAETLHREVIREAIASRVTDLYLYGDFADLMAEEAVAAGLSAEHVQVFRHLPDLSAAVKKALAAGTALAVKASHACGFETIVKDVICYTRGSSN